MSEKTPDHPVNEPEIARDLNPVGEIPAPAVENPAPPPPECIIVDNADPKPSKGLSTLAKRMIKLAIIVFMLIVLQIPLLLVSCQVDSRAERQQEVQCEIASAWGNAQTLSCDKEAEKLNAEVAMSTEIRNRGIYEVPVFIANVKFNAEYAPVAADHLNLYIGGDYKGDYKNNDKCDYFTRDYTATESCIDAGQDLEVLVNGVKTKCDVVQNKIAIPIPANQPFTLNVSMKVYGNQTFQIKTFAKNSKIRFSGNWDDPGFTGSVLPVSRKVSDGKFTADWNIKQSKSGFAGVNLCMPAGSYQKVERTIVYSIFILTIFFFTLFVGEIFAKHEIHPVQYIIASGAPVLFYLLLLALSEHIGFNWAYVISALVIVLMVTGYARMFMGKLKSALNMGVTFAISYAGNFIILQMEDFALLSGTVVMVLILGVLMILTGKINRKQNDNDQPANP